MAADEVQRLLMWRFVDAVKKAVGKPLVQKPGPDSWQKDEVCWPRLEAIKEYALEVPGGNKPLAEQVRTGKAEGEPEAAHTCPALDCQLSPVSSS